MDSLQAIEAEWRKRACPENGTWDAEAWECESEEQRIARLITSSVAGHRWNELTPLDIARHLVSNGVRVVVHPATRHGLALLKSALYATAVIYADHPDFKPEWSNGATQKPPA